MQTELTFLAKLENVGDSPVYVEINNEAGEITQLHRKPINTVADFKRLLQLGAQVHCVYHMAFAGRDAQGQPIYKDEDKGVRKVSRKQTNSFALKTTKTTGEIVDSWCSYPKASEVIIKDNQITILEEDFRNKGTMIPVLTYSIF